MKKHRGPETGIVTFGLFVIAVISIVLLWVTR